MPTDAPRALHFVGSLPPKIFEDRTVLEWFLDQRAGLPVTAVPRDLDPNWIIHYLRSLEDRPAFAVAQAGSYRDYNDFQTYTVARGHELGPDDVALNRVARLRVILDLFRGMRAQQPSLSEARLQISLPHPLDLALFVFAAGAVRDGMPVGPVLRRPQLVRRALRYLPVFAQALVREVTVLTESDGDDLVWQVESPVSTLAALKASKLGLTAPVVRLLANQLVDFLIALPLAARTSVHLCYGDYGKRPLLTPRSLAPVTALLNQVGHRLHVQGRGLPPVHIPCTYGLAAPPTDAHFFQPLARLRQDWPLIAGVVAPVSLSSCQDALEQFEWHAGRRCVAVAASCGLGRMTVEQAQSTAGIMRALAEQDVHTG